MLNPIVAVGIDDRTTQLLTSEGYVLESPRTEYSDSLQNHVKNSGALIIGSGSNIGGKFIESLRRSEINTPAIRIINKKRDEHWSLESADFLDCGGDDVILGQPTEPEEVLLSLQRVCKRAQPEPDHLERFEGPKINLEVNLTKGRARVGDIPIDATGYEMEILFLLASTTKEVSRDNFYEKLHGCAPHGNSLEVHICRLRKHLGEAAFLLHTHRGLGYELLGRVH
jgi:DNA-binding response OmpR family regulator